MTVIALASSIILSTSSLAFGFSRAGFVSVSRVLILFGLLWLITQWCRWAWFSTVGLFAAVFAASIGFWFEISTGWMIAGAVFALFAWDMAEFRSRLRFIAMDDDLRGIERRHVARLSLVAVAGLFLVTIALMVQLRFTFEWAVFLVIVILLGLAQLIAWFRKQ